MWADVVVVGTGGDGVVDSIRYALAVLVERHTAVRLGSKRQLVWCRRVYCVWCQFALNAHESEEARGWQRRRGGRVTRLAGRARERAHNGHTTALLLCPRPQAPPKPGCSLCLPLSIPHSIHSSFSFSLSLSHSLSHPHTHTLLVSLPPPTPSFSPPYTYTSPPPSLPSTPVPFPFYPTRAGQKHAANPQSLSLTAAAQQRPTAPRPASVAAKLLTVLETRRAFCRPVSQQQPFTNNPQVAFFPKTINSESTGSLETSCRHTHAHATLTDCGQ